ncbi:hypothetical protein IW261DRAFT_1420843 [Armillaria novae-zelandiae]|uniref:Uncharacterized protein n=1 Tax=Armillaria novae-zelandiae TaxID=153914 RepID=A0AA39P4W5_9AGAR|nr:hypothetical protein IW261DRAFT_1420843 [Armillaria novae-zelandiae]
MAPLPVLTNFIWSGLYFIAIKRKKSTVRFHREQVTLYIKHMGHLAKGEIPQGWIEPAGYKIFAKAWNEEDVIPSGFPIMWGSTVDLLMDIHVTIDEVFPPLPLKRKALSQGSREGMPPTPGGQVMTDDEFTMATRAIWVEAEASHCCKDRIAQNKCERFQNHGKREDWGIDNAILLRINKLTFSPAPDDSADGSNAIPEDTLPGSMAMDTDMICDT